MAVYADYLDLRFAVGDHVGNRDMSDVMPRLVQQAEGNLNRSIRTRHQITSGTLTFTDGAAPLPADFVQVVNIFSPNGRAMTAGQLSDLKRCGSEYTRFVIDGSSVLIRGLTGTRDIEYYAKIPTISASPSSTNWLLENYPDVYLYAVSFEAAKWLKDVELAKATGELLNGALVMMNIDDERSRWSSGAVRVAGLTP